MDRADLRRIAEAHVPSQCAIDEGRACELRDGWLFPFRSASTEQLLGSQGVIINKATGKALLLGSAFPIERDAAMYDRGFQFERYDLVVTAVRDIDNAVNTLQQVGLSVVEPTYEDGSVWRIARSLTPTELRARLHLLPCIFGDVSLYYKCEVIEEARKAHAFTFELLEYRAAR